jgi:hypothetical protein
MTVTFNEEELAKEGTQVTDEEQKQTIDLLHDNGGYKQGYNILHNVSFTV